MRISEPAQAAEWRPKVAHGETVGLNFKINKAPAGAKEKIGGWVFCRPVRGWKFSLGILPTVSPWATFCRASGALAALVWFIAVGATAQTTNDSVEAIIQGRKLVLQLLEQRPTENFTNTGTLKIRNSKGERSETPIRCEVLITATNWQNTYEAFFTNTTEKLVFIHPDSQIHQLEGDFPDGGFILGLKDVQLGHNLYNHTYPAAGRLNKEAFANSDFWLADLGLEFFHWPQQKVLPKTTNLKRGRDYTLLESTNPNPPTNGYSRVLAWIDKESGGILEAEAYDFNGKLLKDFAPKSFKKVNGQWELQEMEIRNVQTGSRSRLEFDLKK